MFVVAIGQLSGDLETAAPALGEAVGLHAFDVRARLGGPLPRVLFQSQDIEEARRVLLAVRALGHGAIACDTTTVAHGEQMLHAHRFSIDETFFWANERERIAFASIAAIVACATRTEVLRSTLETELHNFGTHHVASPVQVEHSHYEHAVEYAAYLFPIAPDVMSTPVPLLLREHELRYVSLGAALRPTRRENFMLTLELLRARTRAPYDDRFLAHPTPATHLARARDHDDAVVGRADHATDLTAHLVAVWLTHPHAGPYRR